MPDLLIDTNIIIYVSRGDVKYINYLDELNDKVLGVSVVTYMESLLGAKENLELMKTTLETKFEIIEINKEISYKTVEVLAMRTKTSLKNPQFPDIVIANTAIHLNIPLVTNNPKDFKIFKDLEILVP